MRGALADITAKASRFADIESERERNNEISRYGASTKGNTLLQVFGLDRSLIRSAA